MKTEDRNDEHERNNTKRVGGDLVGAVPANCMVDNVAIKYKADGKIMGHSIAERFCLDDTGQNGDGKVMVTSLRSQEGLRPQEGPGAYALAADIPESSQQGQQTSQEFEIEAQTPQVVEEGLVAAMPVDDEPIGIAEAVEWKGRASNLNNGKTRQTRMLVFGAGVCLLTVVLLTVFLTVRSNNGQASSDAAFLPLAPRPVDEYVMSLLPDFTLITLGDSESPQAQAHEWILQDPSLLIYPSWKVQQRFALATLYFSTNGPGWNKAEHWLSYEHDECQWHHSYMPWDLIKGFVASPGVLGPYWEYPVCNEAGAYQQIRLYANVLQGTLPPEMSLLSSLKSIIASSNALMGTLPTELAELSELEVVALPGNDYTGTLPTQYGLLTNLVALGLFHNQIGGSIPSELGLLESIVALNLGINAFTGSLPSELARMDQVERIFFDNNQLTGKIPTQLHSLTGLEILRLDGNVLTGPIPSESGSLGKLTHLDLQNNSLEGSIPTQVGGLESISYFDISGNPMLSGTIPTSFCSQGQVLFNCSEYLCGCDCPCES